MNLQQAHSYLGELLDSGVDPDLDLGELKLAQWIQERASVGVNDAVQRPWMRVDEQRYLVFSRFNWMHPNQSVDTVGPCDEKRYQSLGQRDGEILLHFGRGSSEGRDVAVMLAMSRRDAMSEGAVNDRTAYPWIRVKGDQLIISRFDWMHSGKTVKDDGVLNEARARAVGQNDAAIVLSFRGASLDAQHVGLMLASSNDLSL